MQMSRNTVISSVLTQGKVGYNRSHLLKSPVYWALARSTGCRNGEKFAISPLRSDQGLLGRKDSHIKNDYQGNVLHAAGTLKKGIRSCWG